MSSVCPKINPLLIYPLLVLTSQTKGPQTVVVVVDAPPTISLPIVAAAPILITLEVGGMEGYTIIIPPIDPFVKFVGNRVMLLYNATTALITPT
jgi:hypothetical protein